MTRNSFRQIEAQINEYEDMRAHAIMERNAELRAKLDSCPVADEFGVIVHDDKPHPESMTFEEPMQ